MSAANSFTVEDFSEANFFKALSNSYCLSSYVANINQAKYLFKYLTDLGAKTIIVEDPYTDGDYVDDFASYYAKCFENYEMACKRIHFFATGEVTPTLELISQLGIGERSQEELKEIQELYLGFVVARPLPQAVIGRTVLKQYDQSMGADRYTSLRKYQVNLFGIPFRVDSLAFQVQDTVLAACATVALWTAFHKSADTFGTQTPRPSAITVSANQVISKNRSIPSKGLVIEQMCSAIVQLNLEPELIQVETPSQSEPIPLRSLLYGYLKMGLTPIVIAKIEHHDNSLHAFTLMGYSELSDKKKGENATGHSENVPMVGDRIDAFYGHDDQIGPFARHEVEESNLPDSHPTAFVGTWSHLADGDCQIYPVQILIPIYNKIRVGFTDVHTWVTRLDELLVEVLADVEYEWDQYLVVSNKFKSEIQLDPIASETVRRLLILRQHPKYIWRVIFRVSNVPIFEMLFDATDIHNSFTCYCLIWHNTSFREDFTMVCDQKENQELLKSVLTEKFYNFLKKDSADPVVFHNSD